MIPEKELSVPAFQNRRVRIDGKALTGRDSLLVKKRHLKAAGNTLVLAEGAAELFRLPVGTQRVYRAEWDDRIFAYAGGSLYVRENGGFVRRSGCTIPSDMVGFVTRAGTAQTFAICADTVYKINYNGTETVPALSGGDCGALYRDRLFSAKGNRVSYTQAITPQSAGGGVQGRGYIDLPQSGGEIRRMIVYDDKLLLFRDFGLSYLRVLGDNLNFKAGDIPCCFGRLNVRSVAKHNGGVVFLTESGLFLFDGTAVKRLAVGEDVDYSAPAEGAGFDGTYCAAVYLKSGKRALLVYNFYESSAHILGNEASSVVTGDGICFAEGDELYRLTERGMPQGECAALETELSLLELADGNKYLDAVVVEGTGYFTVEARSEAGSSQRAQGAAGQRLAFRYPVKGNAFAFRVGSYSSDVRIGGLTLYVRQEKRYGY